MSRSISSHNVFSRLVCSSVRYCRFLFLFVVFTSFYSAFLFVLYYVLPELRNKQLNNIQVRLHRHRRVFVTNRARYSEPTV